MQGGSQHSNSRRFLKNQPVGTSIRGWISFQLDFTLSIFWIQFAGALPESSEPWPIFDELLGEGYFDLDSSLNDSIDMASAFDVSPPNFRTISSLPALKNLIVFLI
jgi:hypothetical protein